MSDQIKLLMDLLIKSLKIKEFSLDEKDEISKEFKETYNFTFEMLLSYKNMYDKKKFVLTRIEAYEWATNYNWTGENHWKNIVATAQYKALIDYQRYMKSKGLNIYGIKI